MDGQVTLWTLQKEDSHIGFKLTLLYEYQITINEGLANTFISQSNHL